MSFGETFFRQHCLCSSAQHEAQVLPQWYYKCQVFIPSDEIPPEPSRWTIPAFSAFPQITISQSFSSSLAGLAPVCPCLTRIGLSTPHMTSPVVSRGKDPHPWPAGTTLPLADECTSSKWLQLGLGYSLWTVSFSQFSVHLSVHWSSDVPILLYNKIPFGKCCKMMLQNDAILRKLTWWIYIMTIKILIGQNQYLIQVK